MMTFSFRPASGSTLPLMAASVRTRVVSWKDAADRKESVARAGLGDAKQDLAGLNELQISLTGIDAGLDLLVLDHDIAAVHDAAHDKVAGAGILNADLTHHLADDDLDMLIVDVNALQTVDLLDLADQVVLGGDGALDGQDVLRDKHDPRSAVHPWRPRRLP